MHQEIDKEAKKDAEQAGSYQEQFGPKKDMVQQFKYGMLGLAVLFGKKMVGEGEVLVDAVRDSVAQRDSGESFEKEGASFAYVKEMKELLGEKIHFLVQRCNIDRLFFYIDDLDRLGPEEAVEFLEDLKNYIECENCVFVLALDHEIVRRGLRKKYGDELEDTYAQRFFDKIIQMPFNLPCNRYNIKKYVRDLLTSDPDHEEFAEIIEGFGDTNPRAIKRVFNIMSMYEGIENQHYQKNRGELLAMLLLQTNHECLYQGLMQAIKNDMAEESMKRPFRDPKAFQHTIEWFAHRNGKKLDREDQAVIHQMGKVFSIDEDVEKSMSGCDLLFDIAGATSITGSDLGSTPQTISETKQMIQEYAKQLKFVMTSESGDTIKYEHGNWANAALEIKILRTSNTHINLNLRSSDELTGGNETERKALFQQIFLQDEQFDICIDQSPKRCDENKMDILYNGTGICVLRNVSVTLPKSMWFAGRIMRNIAKHGRIFPEKQTKQDQ